MPIYNLIKFVHVLLAIIAVGFNASYGIWISRAAREPAHLDHVLRGIQLLDNRFANPGYGLLLLTGLTMVVVGNISLTTFWIDAALVLYFIAIVLGLGFYTPALRREIQVLEAPGADSSEFQKASVLGLGFYTPALRREIQVLGAPGADSPEFQKASRRATIIGILNIVPVVLILFLMVVKPTF